MQSMTDLKAWFLDLTTMDGRLRHLLENTTEVMPQISCFMCGLIFGLKKINDLSN